MAKLSFLNSNSVPELKLKNRCTGSTKSQYLTDSKIVFSITCQISSFFFKLLYKAKSRELVTNYRPISLLLTISKLIEKIVYKQVYNYLNSTGQIYKSQYGFRSAHSCEHAIGELLGSIVKNIQLGKDTVTLMLDLSKAFDMLQHSVMYKKLERYGLRGNCLSWFQSYLTGRTLQVKCTNNSGKGFSQTGVTLTMARLRGLAWGLYYF